MKRVPRLAPYAFDLKTLAATLLAALLCAQAAAQEGQTAARPDRGVNPGGAYSVSDVENISLQNGNVNLSIPLASLPPVAGGKLSLTLRAYYNSKLWNVTRAEKEEPSSSLLHRRYVVDTPQLSDEGGWHVGTRYEIILRDARADFDYVIPPPPQPGNGTEAAEYQRLTHHVWYKVLLRTPDGAEQELRPAAGAHLTYGGGVEYPRSYLWGYHTAVPAVTGAPVRYETTDGTYVSAVWNPPGHAGGVNWTLFLPDGTQVVDYADGIQRIRDTNGNKIKIFSDAAGEHYQDEQTGREIRVEYVPGGAPGGFGQIRAWYQTAGGTWQHVDVNGGETVVRGKTYGVSDWNPNIFPEEGPRGDTCRRYQQLPAQAIPVVREIVFPVTEPNAQGRRFSFSYVSDATETATTQGLYFSCGAPPETYTRTASRGMGALSRMVTPTGAQVDYAYTLAATHVFYALDNIDELTRETLTDKYLTHDGVTEHWDYDIPNDGSATAGGVTNPDGSTASVVFFQSRPDFPGGYGSGEMLVGRVHTTGDGLTVTHKHWAKRGSTWATGTDSYTAFNPYVDAEYTTLMEGAAAVKMSARTYEYDYNGNVTKVTEYDWFDPGSVQRDSYGVPTGVPSAAKVLRVTDTSYHNPAPDANSTNYYRLRALTTGTPSLLNAAKEATAGASRTRFSYDGQAYGYAPTAGNVTKVSRRDDKGDADVNNDTEVSTLTTYDLPYGNVTTTTDANGNVTHYYYEDGTHALPTKVEVDPLNGTGVQTTLTTYDFPTGLVTSATDPNGQVSTVDYTNQLLGAVDPFGRPGVVRSPAGTAAGGATLYRKVFTFYEDGARRVRVESDLNAEGDRLLKGRSTSDQLGRVGLTEQSEDGSTYTISAQTVYAQAGRVTSQSSPARSGSPTESWTRVTKDVYGRVVEAATFGGAAQPSATAAANTITNWTGSVTTSYRANETTVTDQAGRKRRSVSDALGRLARVDEPDKSTGALDDSGGNPVQPTSYAYDALGNLRKVDQGGQQRFFMYDSLSRLIRAKNPEQGNFTPDTGTNPDFPALTDTSTGAANTNSQWSTGYKYDGNGNLSKRKDARDVVTAYGYDGLNRNTSVTYTTTGSGAASTPNVVRSYDGATRGKGRLHFVTQSGSTTSATYIDQYDAAGRPLVQRQKFKTNGVWGDDYTVSRTYDLAGDLKTQIYPSGHTVAYTYDDAGRLSGFTGNLGGGAARTYADTFAYDASGRMRQERYGTDTPVYNKHLFNSRGQLAEIRVSTHGLFEAGQETNWNRGALINHYSDSGWGATGGGPDNNGNLKKQDIYIPNDDAISGYSLTTQFYDYDALNRLKQVREGRDGSDRWAQQYDYDRWGNRTINAAATQVYAQNAAYTIPEPQFLVDSNANRLGVPGGQAGQMTYDPAGNLTVDTYQGGQGGGGTRAYDAENRMTAAQFVAGQTQTASYVYDADGRRVKRMAGTSAEVWQVYGLGGELLAEYAPNAAPTQPQKEYGYRGGELLVTAAPTTAQAVSPVNLAQGRAASQSSTVVYNPTGDAWHAVDGNTDGNFMAGSVTHTNGEANPWWEVDLGAVQSIGSLDLWNRTDCCAERLSNFYVFVSDVPFTSTDPAQTQAQSGVWSRYQAGQAAARTTLAVSRTGRYVRVQIASASAVLSLAEVQVWGTQNLAQGKATAQSSTLAYNPPGDAWRAVDGNTDGNYMAGSVTHTDGEVRPWWQVDLGSVRALERVGVWNRSDCCAERLTDFYVLVSEAPFTSTDLSATLGQAGVSAYRVTGQGGRPTQVQVGRTGRYVRVQLASPSTAILSLAEVRVWGADALTTAQGADVRWLVTDQLGTPRMVMDETGSLAGVARHDYLPFGEELSAGGGGRATTQGYGAADHIRQMFTGKERDGETGIDYFATRYYSSKQGRFTSPDSLYFAADRLVDPQKFNLYGYVRNSPLNTIDPDGRKGIVVGQRPQDVDETVRYLKRIAPGTKVDADGTVHKPGSFRRLWNRVSGHGAGTALVSGIADSNKTVAIAAGSNAFAATFGNVATPTSRITNKSAEILGIDKSKVDYVVVFDSSQQTPTAVRQPDGRITEENAPAEVILAHELIHAYRFIHGAKYDPTPTDHVFKEGGQWHLETPAKGELQDVGLASGGNITENKIRRELSYLPRAAYFTRNQWER